MATRGALTWLVISGVAVSAPVVGLIVGSRVDVAVGPDRANARQPTPLFLTQEQRPIHGALARILGASKGVLFAGRTRGGSALLLWVEDTESPGVVNLGELLLVTHSDVLHTLSVLTSHGEEAGDAAPAHVLYSSDPTGDWKRAVRYETQVIGTAVTAMRIEQAPLNQGVVRVSIVLTFGEAGAEETSGPTLQAELPVLWAGP